MEPGPPERSFAQLRLKVSSSSNKTFLSTNCVARNTPEWSERILLVFGGGDAKLLLYLSFMQSKRLQLDHAIWGWSGGYATVTFGIT
jgi:hypothetical protein